MKSHKNLNLIEAHLQIEHFIQSPDFSNLMNTEQAFLTNLNKKLQSLIKQLEVLTPMLKPEEGKDGFYASFELYKQSRQQIISVLKDELGTLLPYLQDELIKSRDDKKKYDPTEDTAYQSMLQKVLNFSIAMINGIKFSNAAIEKLVPKILELHQIAESLGATSIPFSQVFDPLQGASSSEDPLESFRGYCFGQFNFWGKQIHNAAEFHLKIFMNRDIYLMQQLAYQKNFLAILWEGKIANNEVFFSTFLTRNPGFIYDIAIYSNDGRGHSLGFRRIQNTPMIEFFDANIGLFLFPHEKSFKTWFAFLMLTYQLLGMDFNSYVLKKSYSQPDNAQSFLPALQKGNTFHLTPERMSSIIEAFGKLWEKSDNETHKDRIREIFLDVLPVMLNNVSSMDDLAFMRSMIVDKMAFIAKQKKGILSFLSSNPFQQSMDLIDNRLKQLQKENKSNVI